MEFFQGFTVTWAADGPVADLSEEAVRAGWGFIGQVPPAVEQFNAVHRGDGLRQQWLYNQVKGVTNAAGMPLAADATDTLWLAIKSKLDLKQDGLGFMPVQQGGGVGQGNNKVFIGWSGSTLQAQVESTNLGSFVFAGRQFTAGAGLTGGGTLGADRVIAMGTPSAITAGSQNAAGGTTHTHAFNVQLQEMGGTLPLNKGGTGATTVGQARSNLGLDPFAAIADAMMSENGFMELVNGINSFRFIIQWGVATVPADSSLRISWPKPFPTACLNAFSCLGFIFSTTGDAGCSIRDLDANGGTLLQGTATPGIVRYFAIGY
ncbi:hypothetical protein ABE583_02775 [Stenotrophomonas sp. TWI143]|uniref:gp53-like domain-containing protein n=1 Tax=Stenotrophomonas sp. TWI143 TaxID=3136771 RepID=UPI003208E52D